MNLWISRKYPRVEVLVATRDDGTYVRVLTYIYIQLLYRYYWRVLLAESPTRGLEKVAQMSVRCLQLFG